ncbi:hypothetical protein [Sphingobacterium cellulitidis]|nr:hypothetical protein [Sphingobacterium soli]MBA8986443.1 hypothetical protein [Sphingobacterium soli]
MKRSKFLSKSDQTIIMLSTDNSNLTDLMELSDAITEEFSITDYLELDSHFDRIPALQTLYKILYSESEIKQTFSADIHNAKLSLNEGEYILFLLNKKNEALKFQAISSHVKELIDWYLIQLESEIIRNISVLKNYLSNGINTDKEAFSIFLVNPKDDALKKFEHYIFKQTSVFGFDTLAQNLQVFAGRTYDLIKLDYIPYLNFANYSNPSIFENINQEFVTFKEINQILTNYNYFRTDRPLLNLDNKFRLNMDLDVKSPDIVRRVLSNYFEQSIGLTIDKYGNQVFDVFWDNISLYPSKYKIHEYCYNQNQISERINDGVNLKYFIGLLNRLRDDDHLSNATAKFPMILYNYVKRIKLKPTSIKQLFTKEDNINESVRENTDNMYERYLS